MSCNLLVVAVVELPVAAVVGLTGATLTPVYPSANDRLYLRHDAALSDFYHCTASVATEPWRIRNKSRVVATIVIVDLAIAMVEL